MYLYRCFKASQKDIAPEVWGKTPLCDLAEILHNCRFWGPEQWLNGLQSPNSTPWPPYGSPKVTQGKKTPLCVSAEILHTCRFQNLEQCLSRPQTPSSTPWPPYGSLKVTQEKKTLLWLWYLVEFLDTWPQNQQACQFSAHSHRGVYFLWVTFGDPCGCQEVELGLWDFQIEQRWIFSL
jgi:hypothetical protein